MSKKTVKLTESELKSIISESVKKILKESFYDFDYDEDDLSQFDRIMNTDEYLRNEVDFANDGEYIDKLRYQIKGSCKDKKQRERDRNYEVNKSIINSLSAEEYEFLTYVIDEGNITNKGAGIMIDWSVNAWKDGVTGIKSDGYKLVKSLSQKGVGTIHNGILWFNDPSIVDMLDCESNFWRLGPNYKPVRYLNN